MESRLSRTDGYVLVVKAPTPYVPCHLYQVESRLSRTDAHVISGSEDGRVVVWRLVEGTVVATLRAHKKGVCSIACHPKEAQILAASHDGTVSLWDRGSE